MRTWISVEKLRQCIQTFSSDLAKVVEWRATRTRNWLSVITKCTATESSHLQSWIRKKEKTKISVNHKTIVRTCLLYHKFSISDTSNYPQTTYVSWNIAYKRRYFSPHWLISPISFVYLLSVNKKHYFCLCFFYFSPASQPLYDPSAQTGTFYWHRSPNLCNIIFGRL